MPIRISGSTGISGLDGSATTPVLQGASANSGIHYSGNTVFVSTSGTKALTIGPTGNIAFANSNFSIAGQNISVYSGMMKNRIINGDMRIDQRFAGAANNNIASNQYVVDRWRTQGLSAGKLRFQQNNTNGPGSSATQNATGFPNYFGANVVSSNTVNSTDYWFFAQDIEGFNVADLGWGTANASSVTLSFWSYSSIAGTHGGSIRNYDANRSYPFSYPISAANTWQYQTITIPGDTSGSWFSNNSIGLSVFFSMGIGTNYSATAGSWQSGNYINATGSVQPVSAANGALYFTGVQLEKGSQATPFEFRHYTTELSLCQRYFYKLGPNPVATDGVFLNGFCDSTTNFVGFISHPVPMRIGPVLLTTASASDYSIRFGGSNVSNGSSLPVFYGTAANFLGARMDMGSTSLLTGYGAHLRNATTAGFLAFSSELGVQN